MDINTLLEKRSNALGSLGLDLGVLDNFSNDSNVTQEDPKQPQEPKLDLSILDDIAIQDTNITRNKPSKRVSVSKNAKVINIQKGTKGQKVTVRYDDNTEEDFDGLDTVQVEKGDRVTPEYHLGTSLGDIKLDLSVLDNVNNNNNNIDPNKLFVEQKGPEYTKPFEDLNEIEIPKESATFDDLAKQNKLGLFTKGALAAQYYTGNADYLRKDLPENHPNKFLKPITIKIFGNKNKYITPEEYADAVAVGLGGAGYGKVSQDIRKTGRGYNFAESTIDLKQLQKNAEFKQVDSRGNGYFITEVMPTVGIYREINAYIKGGPNALYEEQQKQKGEIKQYDIQHNQVSWQQAFDEGNKGFLEKVRDDLGLAFAKIVPPTAQYIENINTIANRMYESPIGSNEQSDKYLQDRQATYDILKESSSNIGSTKYKTTVGAVLGTGAESAMGLARMSSLGINPYSMAIQQYVENIHRGSEAAIIAGESMAIFHATNVALGGFVNKELGGEVSGLASQLWQKEGMDASVRFSKAWLIRQGLLRTANASTMTIFSILNPATERALKTYINDKGERKFISEVPERPELKDLGYSFLEGLFFPIGKAMPKRGIAEATLETNLANLTWLEKADRSYKDYPIMDEVKSKEVKDRIQELRETIPKDVLKVYDEELKQVNTLHDEAKLKEIAKNANKPVTERLRNLYQKYGEKGSNNKYTNIDTYDKKIEDLKIIPKDLSPNEGVTAVSRFVTEKATDLAYVAAFHIEDFYRRKVEPTLDLFVNRLKNEFGNDFVTLLGNDNIKDVYNKGLEYYNSNNADPFFSGLKQEAVEKLPNKISVEQVKNVLGQKKFSDEYKWVGLDEFLEGKDKVSKDELVRFLNQNQVRLEEVEKGNTLLTSQESIRLKELIDKSNYGLSNKEYEEYNRLRNKGNENTKYGLKDYSSEKLELEGGNDYREFLLISPTKKYEDFSSFQTWLDNNNSRDRYNKSGEYEKTMIAARYNVESQSFEKSVENSRYDTPHWDEKNVIAHIRFNTRYVDGKKVLFVEELQSDWNQQGRKEGYKKDLRNDPLTLENYEARGYSIDKIPNEMSWNGEGEVWIFKDKDSKEAYTDSLGTSSKTPISKKEALEYFLKNENDEGARFDEDKVPQNPFMAQNWKEVAIKRILRYAAENGFDKIAWTSSEQQQRRNNKVAEGKIINYAYLSNTGKYDITLTRNDGSIFPISEPEGISLQRIEELTNKEVRNRIENSNNDGGSINLQDTIKIGKGYGDYSGTKDSRGNYKSGYPLIFEKIGKRFGSKVNDTNIPELRSRELFEIKQRPDGTYDIYNKKLDLFSSSRHFYSEYEAEQLLNKQAKESEDYFVVPSIEITPSMRQSLIKEGQPLYGLSNEFSSITNEGLNKNQPIGIRNVITTLDNYKNSRALLEEAANNTLKDITNTDTGTVLNSGLNPTEFVKQIRLLYKGWTDIKNFTTDIVKRYGDKIKPYAESLFNSLKDFHQDERGFIKNPFRPKGQEVEEYLKNRTPKFDYIARRVTRSAYQMLTNPKFAEVYNSVRDVETSSNGYITNIIKDIDSVSKILDAVGSNENLANVYYHGIETKKTFTNQELQNPIDVNGTLISLRPEEIEAYKRLRNSQDNILNIREFTLTYPYYDIMAKNPTTSQEYINAQDKVNKIQDHYKTLKETGYTSLQRMGRFAAYLEDTNFPVGDEKRIIYNQFDSLKEAQAKIDEWKSQYNTTATGEIYDVKKPEHLQLVSGKLTPALFENLVISAGVDPTLPSIERLRADVYSKFPSATYGLRREFIKGYTRDFQNLKQTLSEQAKRYSNNFFHTIAKEEANKALSNSNIEKFTVQGIDNNGNLQTEYVNSRKEAKQKQEEYNNLGYTDTKIINPDHDLAQVTKQYIQDAIAPYDSNWFSKQAVKARKFTYLMNLAYDASQLMLNGIGQPLTINYGYFTQYLKGIEPEKYFARATKMGGSLLKEHITKTNSPSIPTEFRDLYNRLKDEHIVSADFTTDLIQGEKDVGTITKGKINKWGSVFNQYGEIVARTHAASEAYLVGKEKLGLVDEDLYRFVRQSIDATQGHFAKGENPYYIRSMGEAGKLIYQFNAYTQIYGEALALAIKSDIKNKSIKSTSRQLLPIMALSGLHGLPFAGLAKVIYSLATDSDPNKDLKEALGGDNFLTNMALYGVTSNAGVSQKLGIQVPFVDNIQNLANTNRDTLDFVPAIATGKKIGLGLYEFLGNFGVDTKDDYVFLHGDKTLAPKFVRNTLRGYEQFRGDLRTKSKKKIEPNSLQIGATTLGMSSFPNEYLESMEKKQNKDFRKRFKEMFGY